MDLPPFVHQQQHHHRYVPVPPPPPHNHPTPPLQQNRNFYGRPHHHHFPPPPAPAPVPPPPQPSLFRPLPVPPPPPLCYPHQSQFTFRNPNPEPNRPIDDHGDFNLHPPRVFKNDHRVSHHFPEPNHFSDSRPDIWELPPRVLPENPSIRPYSPLGLDFDSRHRLFDREPVSPYRPVDKFRHDSECSSRLREDFSDGFIQNHREELAWDQINDHDDNGYHFGSHLLPNHIRSSRNFVSGGSDLNLSLREFFGNSESRQDTEYGGVSENQRCGHSRQPSRNYDSSFGRGANDYGDDGDFSGQHVARVSDFGNFDSRGSRESTQEYDRTPRKKMQKKSAFLRIQLGKSNYRNRDDSHLQSSSYYDESNTSPFKGKDLPAYWNRRIEEDRGERERSPVELDVSFKSNSLVAKAILTPPGPVVSSDRNSIPTKNRKIRKLKLPVMDNSSSPEVKLSHDPLNLENSMHVSNALSGSVKDRILSEAKVSGGTPDNVCLNPGSCGTSSSLKKRTVEGSPKATVLTKGGSNVDVGEKSLTKFTKKKVVKKVMAPHSSLWPAKKDNEPVKEVSSTGGQSAASRSKEVFAQVEDKTAFAGTVSRSSEIMLPESKILDGSPQAIVSEESCTGTDRKANSLEALKNRNSSTPPFALFNPEKSERNEDSVDTDRSVHALHAITGGVCNLQDNTNFTEIGSFDDVDKPSSQIGLNVSHENNEIRGKPQVMFIGCPIDIGLSESKLYDASVTTHISDHGGENALITDNDLGNNHKAVTVSDTNTVDAESKQPFLNQISALPKHGLMEGFSKDASSVYLSNSEESMNHGYPLNADRSNHAAVIGLNSDFRFLNFPEKIALPSINTMDHIKKHPCPNEVTLSLANGSKEGCSKAVVSVTGNIFVASSVECTSIKLEDREARSPHSNTLRPVNTVSHADDLDLTLNSFRNYSPAIAEVCTGEFGESPRNTSPGGFPEDNTLVRDGVIVSQSGISRNNGKKRKLFTLHAGLSSPTVSQINDGSATADISTSSTEAPLDLNNGLIQPGQATMATAYTVDFPTFLKGNALLHENITAYRPLGLVGDGFRDATSRIEQQSSDPETMPNVLPSSPLRLGGEQKENATSVLLTTNQQNFYTDLEKIGEEKTNLASIEGQIMITDEIVQCRIPLEHWNQDSDKRFCGTDMDCDRYLPSKNDLPSLSNCINSHDLPSLSNCINSPIHGKGVSTDSYSDEGMDSVPDTPPSNRVSPENLSILPAASMPSPKLSFDQTSNDMVSKNDKNLEEKSVFRVGSDDVAASDHSFTTQAVSVLSQEEIQSITRSENLTNGEANKSKSQQIYAVPRMYPGHSSVYFNNAVKTSSSTHITKPRSWSRTGNPSASPLPGAKSSSSTVPPVSQLSKKIGKVQNTSYVRKGNSLVMKPGLTTALSQGSRGLNSTVYQLNSAGLDELKKSAGSRSGVHVTDPPVFSRTGGIEAALQRPRTPTLPLSPGYCTSSPLAEPVIGGYSESTTDTMRLIQDKDVKKSSENAAKFCGIPETQNDPVKSTETEGLENHRHMVSSKAKNVIYVKHKSNQLVAASNPCNSPHINADKTEALADGFYKRKRNQLIRTSFGSHMSQQVAVAGESSNFVKQRASKVSSSTTSNKRWSNKGAYEIVNAVV